MKHEQLIREINNMIINNRAVRCFIDSLSAKEQLRENNNLLGKIETILKDADNEYNRGGEDCMNLVRKIACLTAEGGYNGKILDEIFGRSWSPSRIFRDHSFKELKDKIDAYEQKKKEEAEKPVVGDVVRCSHKYGTEEYVGIVRAEEPGYYYIMTKDNVHIICLLKSGWIIKKTGKHLDIQGMLDEIKTED